jgi:hypothetical protein
MQYEVDNVCCCCCIQLLVLPLTVCLLLLLLPLLLLQVLRRASTSPELPKQPVVSDANGAAVLAAGHRRKTSMSKVSSLYELYLPAHHRSNIGTVASLSLLYCASVLALQVGMQLLLCNVAERCQTCCMQRALVQCL